MMGVHTDRMPRRCHDRGRALVQHPTTAVRRPEDDLHELGILPYTYVYIIRSYGVHLMRLQYRVVQMMTVVCVSDNAYGIYS